MLCEECPAATHIPFPYWAMVLTPALVRARTEAGPTKSTLT
jgi:hypothetical protein